MKAIFRNQIRGRLEQDVDFFESSGHDGDRDIEHPDRSPWRFEWNRPFEALEIFELVSPVSGINTNVFLAVSELSFNLSRFRSGGFPDGKKVAHTDKNTTGSVFGVKAVCSRYVAGRACGSVKQCQPHMAPTPRTRFCREFAPEQKLVVWERIWKCRNGMATPCRIFHKLSSLNTKQSVKRLADVI